jgi:hypothetical protein
MSHLLQQDSRNTNLNPVRRPVGGHNTGIPEDPRSYNVVPAMMHLPPAPPDVDPFSGHPRVAKPHMEELKADPNQPGIDRITASFARARRVVPLVRGTWRGRTFPRAAPTCP